MQGNRSRDTRPELALRRACHRLGLRYRVCAEPLPGMRRRIDMVFRTPRVAVELYGCLWHGCPEHFKPPRTNPSYWAAKIDRNRDRDQTTATTLAAADWE